MSDDSQSILAKRKILVVDDALDIQYILQKYLEEAGASVAVAQNGNEALRKHQQSVFDLILIDLHLPDMTGYEIAEKLRQQGCTSHMYAFTALSENYLSKAKLEKSGFSGCVSKDFSEHPLREFPKLIFSLLAKTPENSNSAD